MDIPWVGTPNYNSGNDGIQWLMPHWTCGGFDGSVATLRNPARQASANYVIEGTRVVQLVRERDTAWSCGNRYYNRRSVSYELVGWPGHPPTRETLDTCAELMAQASREYFGGAPLVHGENVKLHREVYATSCPGTTDIDYLLAKANELLAPPHTPSHDIHTADADGSDAQRWYIRTTEEREDGTLTVSLRNFSSWKWLSIPGSSTDPGTPAQIWGGDDDDEPRPPQVMTAYPIKGRAGMYTIEANAARGQFLTVPAGRVDAGTPVEWWPREEGRSQEWYLYQLADKSYRVVNAGSWKLLEAVGGGV